MDSPFSKEARKCLSVNAAIFPAGVREMYFDSETTPRGGNLLTEYGVT